LSTPLRAAWPEATWHTLFYDLAFVAAVLVLAGSYSVDYTLINAIWITLAFTLLWTTWLITSLVLVRVPMGLNRVGLVALQMGMVLAAAVAAGGAVAQAADLTEVIFGGMLITVAALLGFGQPAAPANLTRTCAGQILAAGVILASSYVLPWWWYFCAWPIAVALVLVVAVRLIRSSSDSAHTFNHRFGELTMIVLGEAFVKVGLADDADGLNRFRIAALILIIVIITTLWVAYFGVVVRSDAGGSGRLRLVWAALHLPLHLGLVFLAVGLAKLLIDSTTLLHGGIGWLLIVPLALTLVAMSALSLVSSGRPGRPIAQSLAVAAGVAGVVALATPYVDWLTPVVATWLATIPLLIAVAGLRVWLMRLLRRDAPDSVARDDASQAEVEA
jgi:low temperature requirement protein LtrA